MAYQVKGSTLKSKLAFVEERFGAGAVERLDALIKEKAEIYPLLTGAWYPFELFVEVLESIAENHYDGDLKRLEQLGAYSARKTLGTVYKAFVREGNFVGFLQDHANLHHMFYNEGVTKVEVHPDTLGADILHRDKPMVADADLHVGVGFYTEAAHMHGMRHVDCSFKAGKDSAHFVIRWSQ